MSLFCKTMYKLKQSLPTLKPQKNVEMKFALKYLLINEDETFFAINLLQYIRPID